MSEIIHPVVEENTKPAIENVRIEEYVVSNANPQEFVVKETPKPRKIIRPWYEMIDRR